VTSALGNIDKIPLEWEITNKTKKIGKYTCRQAKTTEKIYSRDGYFLYNNIIAWFAPDIPISFGPKNYNGLPGLILQIDYKEFTLTAIQINLNIREKDLEIKRVDDIDKLVSEKESHKRIEEVMSDREKMYKN
jgi:GLPGLI family protein